MRKRNYTQVQALLPEIKVMLSEGKTQREVAEHFGFKDKYVVKQLLIRECRKERKLATGIVPRPKGRPKKLLRPKIWWQSRRTRFSGYRWKTGCYGIFCTAPEGSECKGKIPCYISSQSRVSRGSHVQVLCRIQKRLLRLCPSPW